MNLRWEWSAFEQLSASALYAMMKARQDVFIVEQSCAYPDMDGRDPDAHHLLGWDTSGEMPRLAAYLRTLPAGARFKEPSIGHVITTAPYRAKKLGHALMSRGIDCTLQTFGVRPLRIFAQSHLQGFYAKHGFVGEGEEYAEDGIMHREMVLPQKPSI